VSQALLSEALKRYPSSPKLWMMAGQLAEEQGNPAGARGLYQRGLKQCPTSIPLWKLAAQLEVRGDVHR
jgi:pre-mRNA-processing factor 6